MPDTHLSPQQLKEIAMRTHPKAFDSREAEEQFEAKTGIHIGNESVPYSEVVRHMGELTSHEHELDVHKVAGIVQEVSGIPTVPLKH